MAEALLHIENLTVCAVGRTRRTTLVDGLELVVRAGERVAIVGESGSGKSLSCLSVMGLLPSGLAITGGSIRFNGKELLDRGQREYNKLRGTHMGMIYQEPLTSLNPLMRIGQQVGETLSGADRKSNIVHEALERVGIADPQRVSRQFPHELSGGMRQRVMIAMATVKNPELLIADEPTTALDVTIQTQVLKVMYEISVELGTAILLVSHDLGAVERLVDRIVVMYAGRIVEDGPTRSVMDDPKHPYTKALLGSSPRIQERGVRLPVIGGNVPAPGSWPSGCRFAPRCQLRQPICEEATPVMNEYGWEHEAACWALESEGKIR